MLEPSKNVKKSTLGALPEGIRDAVSRRVNDSSVALVETARLQDHLGSGTLVMFRGRRAILTAGHVAHSLAAAGSRLGVAFQEAENETSFDGPEFTVQFARGFDADLATSTYLYPYCIDVAVIILPDHHLGMDQITAVKTFHNLDDGRHRLCESLDPPTLGYWVVSGTPAEWSPTVWIDSATKLLHLRNVAYTIDNPRQPAPNEYDYITFDMRSPIANNVPSDLEGMSGGGVWHISVIEYDGTLRLGPEPALSLSGVVVRESDTPNDSGRDLICHGRSAVYLHLYPV
jgi:hypothetical protein